MDLGGSPHLLGLRVTHDGIKSLRMPQTTQDCVIVVLGGLGKPETEKFVGTGDSGSVTVVANIKHV